MNRAPSGRSIVMTEFEDDETSHRSDVNMVEPGEGTGTMPMNIEMTCLDDETHNDCACDTVQKILDFGSTVNCNDSDPQHDKEKDELIELYLHCITNHSGYKRRCEDANVCGFKQWQNNTQQTMRQMIHCEFYRHSTHDIAIVIDDLNTLNTDETPIPAEEDTSLDIEEEKTLKPIVYIPTMLEILKSKTKSQSHHDGHQFILQFGHPFTAKTARFDNPKEEILQNDFRTIRRCDWNDLLKKCVGLNNTIRAKHCGLNLRQLVALKLYTDFDDLQRELRKCFRKGDDQYERQRQFYHWNSLLETACNQSNDIITSRIYHGVNKPLMLSSFSGTYYGPISTTTMFDIATQFAGSNGRILELYPSFSKRGLRVSWLSNFADEDEVLYMNASFQIVNIYTSEQSTNMYISPFDEEASPFERAIMKAIQMINVDSHIISFNSNGPPMCGFCKLAPDEQVAVLYLLYLQYKKNEWREFVHCCGQHVSMAIARYRDQFITLANNVQAVKMEGASKLICQFFARVHEETYVFPVIKMNNASDACVEGDNFINLCTFCKLFPHCKQVKMNGDNFDWSLDGMIAFLSKYNLNYSRIALQDIYIRFTAGDESERLAKRRIREVNLSESKLDRLSKLGWQFVNGTRCHLHRYGFKPHPELPFLSLFHTLNEEGQCCIVPYNPKVCDLSCNVFDKHSVEHQSEIVALFKSAGASAPNKRLKVFVDLCRNIERLVLDPMPHELRPIFIEQSNTKLQRDIISFESIVLIFPNVQDVFLRDTRFSLRIWYNLLKSIKKHHHKWKLCRIFFSKQYGVNQRDLKTMDLRFKPHGWKFEPNEQLIFTKLSI